MVLEFIAIEYQNHGESRNLTDLVDHVTAGCNPIGRSAEQFHADETALHEQFLDFVQDRPVVAASNHPVVARTRRWVRHVNAYEPVTVAQHERDRDLQAVPIIEYQPIDTFSPEVVFSGGKHAHSIGIALSFLQPHQILKHAVIANPWLNIKPRRIGLLRQLSPEFHYDVSKNEFRRQQVFRMVFDDILASLPGN